MMTPIVIALWLFTLALAFAAGWIWRNGRLHEHARQRAVNATSIGDDRSPNYQPPGEFGDTHVHVHEATPRLAPGEIPVRGSDWWSETDVVREGARAHRVAARAERSPSP